MAKFNGLVENIEDNRNKVTSIGENPTNTEYPSAKAVKDCIDNNDNGFIKSDGSVSMADDLNMAGNTINGCKAMIITQAPSAAGSIDRFVGNVGFNDTRYLKQADKVTSISSSSTDTQIPSAKAVKTYVDEHGGGGTTESAFSVIASESGTSESTNEITITFDRGYKEIQLALNIPPPASANLSYCRISIHTVGNKTYTVNNTVAIQTTHTKAALTIANFNAEKNIVTFAINTASNLGRTYADIQSEAAVNQQNGATGFCGASWNFANDEDYYIDRIVLRPTNNSSAFEAGTNYIVWGR